MSHSDEHFPEDLRDIAQRLTEARPTLSAFELDDLRGRVHGRVTRPSAGRRAVGRFRRSTLVAILASALMLTSGAGVVIAAGSFGGGDRYVFQTTSVTHESDASFCQYQGPTTFTRVILTRFGIFTISTTFYHCKVIDFHISFHPFFPFAGHSSLLGNPNETYGNIGYFGPGLGGGSSEPYSYSFGNGPAQTTTSTSVDTSAPIGTTGMTIAIGGSTYTLPISTTGS